MHVPGADEYGTNGSNVKQKGWVLRFFFHFPCYNWSHLHVVGRIASDICPQIDEAKSEHLVFKLALKWGHLKEKDAKKKAFVEKAHEGGHVGNLAWGNGSMQGFPDASTYINTEIGLNGVKAFLEEQVDRFGTVKKENKGKVRLTSLRSRPKLPMKLPRRRPSTRASTRPGAGSWSSHLGCRWQWVGLPRPRRSWPAAPRPGQRRRRTTMISASVHVICTCDLCGFGD